MLRADEMRVRRRAPEAHGDFKKSIFLDLCDIWQGTYEVQQGNLTVKVKDAEDVTLTFQGPG